MKKILDYRGVLLFYAIIILSIIGLNARLAALNKDEVNNEIAMVEYINK